MKENEKYVYNEETKEYEFHCEEWDTVDEKLEQMWLERWEKNEDKD